jgi:PD-(D/E)XK nuclease superfamily
MNEQAHSPFLSGTNIQYAWDSTSLGYLKTCPRLYYYNMICGWVPKDESVHLRFGQEYHAAIEDYDKLRAEGRSFNDAVRSTIRNLLVRIRDWDSDPTTKAGNYKNPRTLVQLVVDYLDEFRTDPATTYILENGKPAVELSFKFELGYGPTAGAIACHVCGGSGFTGPHNYDGVCNHCGGQKLEGKPQPYIICGHLDRVVELGGSLFGLDHKTTTTAPTSYWFDGFNPNNQMTLYTLALQIVYDVPVKGIIVEAAQIMLEKPNRFERGTTFRTQDQLDEWLADLEYWLGQAESFATAEHWPMNDTACDKFGGCRFRGVCSKSPSVRGTWLNADFIQLPQEERWDPLKPR